jgi:PadR family transcriptional regulator PadR
MVVTVPDRSTQLLHGVLDMCLMSIIAEEASYGYEMVHKLRNRGLDLASEGSIYPLLSRLQRQGMIEGYLVQSSEGPARKYYRMTGQGRAALSAWRQEWDRFSQSVNAVLEEPAMADEQRVVEK